MAAERRLRSNWKRSRVLPIVLGLAVFACAVAFWWVSGPSGSRYGRLPDEAATRIAWPAQTEGGAFTAASAPPAGGAADRATVSVMTLGNELTAEQIAEFEALNPDIRIAFLEFSSNLLDILIATKDLPDVFRLGQVEHVPLANSGLLLDITTYIARSKVIKFEELSEQSTTEVAVDGRYYGLPQGLATPDFASLYINREAFRNAGIPIPSLKEPLTYAELGTIARKLSAKMGRPAFYSFFFERVVAATMAQRGTSMFSEDMREMKLTGNPKALEVIRYFYDLAISGAMHVPPAKPSIAVLFENGELPISQSGYWMGAVVTPETAAYGRVAMLPPPVWDRSLPRFGAFLGGTKLVVSAASKHPQEAYRFIEWYVAGKPAEERARRGWGFPLLRSMEHLLPQATEFDRQRLQVARDTLSLPVAKLPTYPSMGILPAFNQSWIKNIEMAKAGDIKFAEFASNLQEDVNLAIRDDTTRRNEEKIK